MTLESSSPFNCPCQFINPLHLYRYEMMWIENIFKIDDFQRARLCFSNSFNCFIHAHSVNTVKWKMWIGGTIATWNCNTNERLGLPYVDIANTRCTYDNICVKQLSASAYRYLICLFWWASDSQFITLNEFSTTIFISIYSMVDKISWVLLLWSSSSQNQNIKNLKVDRLEKLYFLLILYTNWFLFAFCEFERWK